MKYKVTIKAAKRSWNSKSNISHEFDIDNIEELSTNLEEQLSHPIFKEHIVTDVCVRLKGSLLFNL